MKFGKYGEHREVKQDFDIKNTFIEQAGEKINIYDKIQAATEDTDIYQTLEKYGSLKPIELNAEGVFAEFEKTMSKRDVEEQQKAADNMWSKLPLKVREQFNNNKYEFLTNGQKWLQKQIEEQQKKVELSETKISQETNEQKQEVKQ